MKREDLQKKLVEILGSNHVYYQSPSNVRMTYPAIRYGLDNVRVRSADNKKYMMCDLYAVVHIYQNPKDEMKTKMLNSFQFIRFTNRSYVDGLYNDRYEIYW